MQHKKLSLNHAGSIGLAIYLAGRLLCIPSADNNTLKLLVLDDVLIGLDNSNRLPVLDVLRKKFADWQIVLLTYDRNWFDLARQYLPEPKWTCYEIYEGDRTAPAPIPIVYQTSSKPARALLKKAQELVSGQYIEAAANYTRQSFEYGIRQVCELKGIPIPYHSDPKKRTSQEFLNGLKAWKVSGQKITQADWNAAINKLETMRNVVMNPYSHSSAQNIPKKEVEEAIKAVEDFLDLVKK